jgi:hypothetical protein
VTPRDALEAAQEAGRTGRLLWWSTHAHEQARERNVTRCDARAALASATQAIYQPENDRWRIEGGKDLDGDDLTVVVVFEGGVIIVTFF